MRAPPTTFELTDEQLAANERLYFDHFCREGAEKEQAAALAIDVARSFSGVALWPRLVLDVEVLPR